jgi:hypothetical protein
LTLILKLGREIRKDSFMKRLILLVLVVGLMTTGSAFAASSATKGAYSGPGGVVSNLDPSHNTRTFSSSNSKGSLPFTGLDLALLALGGAGLVGVGMGVRRLSRPLA